MIEYKTNLSIYAIRGDLNTLPMLLRSKKQKIQKLMYNIKSIISKFDLMDIMNTTLHIWKTYLIYRDISNMCRNDNNLAQKASLNKFQRFNIVQTTFSNHNENKLKISNKNRTRNVLHNLGL